MKLMINLNEITNKIVEKLLMESYEHSSTPGMDMDANYIYHCADIERVPKIFKHGFERYFFGKGVGEMYGPGIYCTSDLQSSIVNAKRGLYGRAIIRAEIKTYKDCLIWQPVIAKEVYGTNWRIKDQLRMLVPEYIEQMKNMPVMGDYQDGSKNMYNFLIRPRERTSVAARQIWLQKNNFKGGGPYRKIRGFVFYGSADGHVGVLRDAKNAIPLEYSLDYGKTWKYARTEQTLRYTRDDFDVQLDYGDRYDDSIPPEYGWARVKKNNKTNYINKNGKEISKTWFDKGGDFYETIDDFPTATVVYKGKSFFLDQDGEIYEALDDDVPYCKADELPNYV